MIWRKHPKTPIWIKNKRTKLYEPIPYEKMTQFPNGEWGFTWNVSDPQSTDFISRHHDHFEYRPGIGIWLFKPRGTKIDRLLMYARSSAAGGLCTCLVVSITNFMSGEYIWVIPAFMCMGALASLSSMLIRKK